MADLPTPLDPATKNTWGAQLNTALTDLSNTVGTASADATYARGRADSAFTALAGKADLTAVYTKTSSDTRFIRTVNGGTPDANGNVVVIPPGTGTVTKGDVGLGSVDNTSDLGKPLSTAATAALALKQDTIPHYADQAAAQAAATGGTITNGRLVTWG